MGHRSGLLGVSGYSPDMRDVLKGQQAGNPDATLAVQMFCYRARKYIGAYLAALGGVDGIVFGGGIGGTFPCDQRANLRDDGMVRHNRGPRGQRCCRGRRGAYPLARLQGAGVRCSR